MLRKWNFIWRVEKIVWCINNIEKDYGDILITPGSEMMEATAMHGRHSNFHNDSEGDRSAECDTI